MTLQCAMSSVGSIGVAGLVFAAVRFEPPSSKNRIGEYLFRSLFPSGGSDRAWRGAWHCALKTALRQRWNQQSTLSAAASMVFHFFYLLPYGRVSAQISFCKWWLNSRVAGRVAWRADNSPATTMKPTVDIARCSVNDFSLLLPVTV